MSDHRYFDLPYNFVPLSGFVHRPADLAQGISQDVPFPDGLCGTLDIELVALSDLLVSRGTERTGNGPGEAHMFELMRPEGVRTAIPSTSVRGMVRSVLEIASFGKMSRVDDRRFGTRDLHAAFYRDRMTTTLVRPKSGGGGSARGYVPLSRSGWLYLKTVDGRPRWFIRECEYGRVDIGMLKRYGLASSAKASECRDEALELGCIACEAEADVQLASHESHSLQKRDGPKHLVFRKIETLRNANGETAREGRVRGYLVFTNVVVKKKRQFFFYNSYGCEMPVDDAVMRGFFEVNPATEKSDEGSGRESPTLWGYWKKELLAGRAGPGSPNEPGIPIFFVGKNDTRSVCGTRILAVGLAQMIKLPNDYSIRDMIRHTSEDHFSSAPDLPEIIFGTASDDQGPSWRGRVTFSHLEAEHAARGRGARLVLNSPKPTFYPAYVEQPGMKHESYLAPVSGTAAREIRGWKRYQAVQRATHDVDLVYQPSRFYGNGPAAPSEGAGDKLATRLHPVAAGTSFRGRIHIHNLRPVELGALLWAIGLGEDVLSPASDRQHNHGIGMGKPFGFGRCALRVSSGEIEANRGSSACFGEPAFDEMLRLSLAAFADHMERHYAEAAGAQGEIASLSWSGSPQIQALKTLTNCEGHPQSTPHLKLIPKGWALRRPDGSLQGYPDWPFNEFVLAKQKPIRRLRPIASNHQDQKAFPRPTLPAAEMPDLPLWLKPSGKD